MRIAQVSDTFLPVVDGVGRVVVAYAENLSKMGHQITVCCPMYDTGHRGGYPFELVDFTGFKVPSNPQYKTGSPVMDSHYRKRIDMIPLDIIHAHSPFAAGTEALRLARQRAVPLVTTFHSKYYEDFVKATKSQTISKALISAVVNFYQKCDEVWAVSHSSIQVLREYGYDGPVQVISNGTALRSTSEEAIHEVTKQYSLNDDPVLLFVGQINWKKNILRILEAASLLARTFPAFKLVLAGQGPDEEEIKLAADELGIKKQLIMTGMITDTKQLDALYARAQLFVFPSLYDTFSMVVREAAAMGTPSVVVEGSCAAEAIKHLHNGYLCQDNADSLFTVIKSALTDSAAAKSIGQTAKQTLPVTWPEVLEQAVSRYEHLINNYQKKPHPSHARYKKRIEPNE